MHVDVFKTSLQKLGKDLPSGRLVSWIIDLVYLAFAIVVEFGEMSAIVACDLACAIKLA